MKAETRFPRTVEAYKAHLHEDRPHYDSFQTFCRKQGVGYKGVMQWMHRHNRSVGSLRLEVLLEKNGNDSVHGRSVPGTLFFNRVKQVPCVVATIRFIYKKHTKV